MKKAVAGFLTLSLLAGCSGGAAKASAPAATADAAQMACRAIDTYDYATDVPLSDAVTEDYYADTLFAGDSRMGALALYGTHPTAEVEYVTSFNLMLIQTMKIDGREDGATLYDVLSTTTKNNIYLLFGINGIRNRTFDPWAEQFQSLLTMLKTNNPEVNIYIILAYHPDYISGLDDEQLTTQLQDINTHMINLATGNYCYYLNADYALAGDDGKIRPEYVADGLHLQPSGAHVLEDFIATHVVRRENYVEEICE
jgi:lysophospholipase L1-like esterase